MPPSHSTQFPHNRAALLNVILLFFGTILTLAAIIFFFAYNWDALPKLAKLGTIQIAFIACALGATISTKRPILSQTLLFAASIFVGVFLAVFGQIYQTGADPWQLFTLWAALIIPFAIIAKNQIQWITFATLATIGTGRLFYYFIPQYEFVEPIGFTFQALFPSLFFAAIWLKFERDHRTKNLPKPWSRPLLAAIIFAVITIGIAITSHGQDESSTLLATIPFYALLAAVTAVAWQQFGRSNLDITVLGIAAIAWLLATSWTIAFALIRIDLTSTLLFLFMAVYVVTLSSAFAFKLRQLTPQKPTPLSVPTEEQYSEPQQEHPAESSPSRILPILSGISGWLAATFVISAVLCGIGTTYAQTLTLAIIISVAVFSIEYQTRKHATRQKNVFLDQAINASSLAAQVLFAVTFFLETSAKSFYLPMLAIALTGTLHYAFIRSTELRFLTTITFLTSCILYLTLRHDVTNLSPIIVPSALAASLLFLALPYIKQSIVNAMSPAAYAAILVAFVVHWTPEIYSQTITTTAITLTALALAIFENRRNPNARKLLITAAILAAITLTADHTLLWAITLLSIGLWRQRTALTTIGILCFATSLTIYYYNLDLTLLTKSGLLLATGLLFIALFWFLELNKNNTNPTSHEVNP